MHTIPPCLSYSPVIHLQHVSFDQPLTPRSQDIILIVCLDQPYTFRFNESRYQPHNSGCKTIYLRFHCQELIQQPHPVLLQYKNGGFWRGHCVNHRWQTQPAPYLDNSITYQLGLYLYQLLAQPIVDFIYFEQLLCLLTNCLLEQCAAVNNPHQYRGGLTPRQLKAVDAYVEESISQVVSVQDLANVLQLSIYHFSRMFKRCTGDSPRVYVIKRKMRRARTLLTETELPVIQVGLEVGYGNSGHFSTTFKRVFGHSPTTCRRLALLKKCTEEQE